MFSYGSRKCGTMLCDSWVFITISVWILELGKVLTMKKEGGNVHDRFVCGIYLRAAFNWVVQYTVSSLAKINAKY